MAISPISLCVNVLKSSDLLLDAETTRIFFCGFIKRWWHTKAEVIHDFPTPRKASITRRFGPSCKKSAMSYCISVGSGKFKCFQHKYKKFLKSS